MLLTPQQELRQAVDAYFPVKNQIYFKKIITPCSTRGFL